MTKMATAQATTVIEDTSIKDISVKEGESPEGNILAPEGWSIDSSFIGVDPQAVDYWVQTTTQWLTSPWFWPIFTLLLVWAFVWKGLALWHSARNGQRNWFIALLLMNTLGIVEICYLKWGQRKKPHA